MAEWWVDPENGLTTNAGTSADVPWQLIPGQTGASAQTGYTVAAGDTINVRNGTVTTLVIAAPANNLTYRGYGLADNVLYVPLPSVSGPVLTRVVRETGVHEGMWIVDGAGASPFSMLSSGARSGCVFEDFHVRAPLSSTPVSFGVSSSTAIGVTGRRFKISGAADTGLDAYTRTVLLEDFLIEDVNDDGITIGASASNGYRAGYRDLIRRFAIINPGSDTVAGLGDAFQIVRHDGSIELEDFYLYKNNLVKQGMALTDIRGRFSLKRFYFDGPDDATVQILIAVLMGSCYIGQGVVAGGCALYYPFVRMSNNLGGTVMGTGSKLTMESVLLLAEQNNGLFVLGSGLSGVIDGEVDIHGCYARGVNNFDLSYAGTIASHPGAAATFGGNEQFSARNNIIESTGAPAFRIPSGAGGSSAHVVENNVVASGITAAIGSTSYADIAAFEAAHAVGDNQQTDPLLDASYRPLAGSPVIGTGTYLKSARHMGGKRMSPVSPDIGAYQYSAPHSISLTRTV